MTIISVQQERNPPVVPLDGVVTQQPITTVVAAPYAAAGPLVAGTSNSNVGIDTVLNKTFVINEYNRSFFPGTRIRATAVGYTNVWLEGIVVSWDGETMVLDGDLQSGTGNYSNWQINVAGQPGVQGQTGPVGPVGPSGGPIGPVGPPGQPGSQWHTGSGAPANSLGADGDYYLDDVTNNVWVRASGAYAVQANIGGAIGPQGPTGPVGPTGPMGTVIAWRNGTGAPANSLGADLDYYLDDATGNVYQRASGVYTIVANIKGPQGIQGIQGIQGPPGASGSGSGDVVHTLTLTAGAGLTGGGDLSANRTFDVGAGPGITVAADTVGLTVPVAIANGGTNATTAAGALTQLGALPIAGGVSMTGQLSVAYASGSPQFNISPPSGLAIERLGFVTGQGAVLEIFNNTAGAARWKWWYALNNETGSNAGADFSLQSFTDGGTVLDTPLAIARASSIAAFSQPPTHPTPTAGDSSTKSATTAFVQGILVSPTFTGTPKAPTPSTPDNSTNIATTAFVKSQGYITGSFLPLTGGTLTGPISIGYAAGYAINITAGNFFCQGSGAFGGSISTSAGLTINGGGYSLNIPGGGASIAGACVFGAGATFAGSVTINAGGTGLSVPSGGASFGALTCTGTSLLQGAVTIQSNMTAGQGQFAGTLSGTNQVIASGTGAPMFTWSVPGVGFYWRAWANNTGGAELIIDNYSAAGVLLSPGSTAWAAYSDIRLKKNIENYQALDRLKNFRAIAFDPILKKEKDAAKIDITPKRQVGIIAQEIAEDFPELVLQCDGKLAIYYSQVGVVALQGVKELLDLVVTLQKRVETLERRLKK